MKLLDPSSPRLAALAAPLALGLGLSPLAAQAPVVRSPHTLSLPATAPDATVALGVDGDRVAAVFVATDPVTGGRAVQVALSADAGVSFGSPRVLDDDTTSATDSVVEGACAVLGDAIYVAWLDERLPGLPGLHFTASTDGGATFSAPRRLSDGYPGTGAVTAWDFAVVPEAGGDDVHVLFAAVAPGVSEAELFSLSSEDGGVTFSSPRLVYGAAASGVAVGRVALRVVDDTVHAAWDDDSLAGGVRAVWYSRSLDGGLTFPVGRQRIFSSDLSGTRTASLQALEVTAGRVGVLFATAEAATGAGPELRLALSADAGASFAADRRISDAPLEPALALAADHHLVADVAGGDVVVALSRDAGASYSYTTLATGVAPRLATDGSDRHVVTWLSTGPTATVHAAFTLDAATTWSAPLALTDGTGGIGAVQGPVRLAPGLGNVVALAGQVPAIGGAWLSALGFSVAGGASATSRNAGTNPVSLASAPAVFGKIWAATVDCGSTGHVLAGLFAGASPTALPLPGGQTLLANPFDGGGELLGEPLRAGPVALFGVSVPNDPRLAGFSLTVQGLHVAGAPGFRLTNAYDLVLGAF